MPKRQRFSTSLSIVTETDPGGREVTEAAVRRLLTSALASLGTPVVEVKIGDVVDMTDSDKRTAPYQGGTPMNPTAGMK